MDKAEKLSKAFESIQESHKCIVSEQANHQNDSANAFVDSGEEKDRAESIKHSYTVEVLQEHFRLVSAMYNQAMRIIKEDD